MNTIKKIRLGFALLALPGMIPNVNAHDNKTIHPTLTDLAYKSWLQKDNGKFFEKMGIKENDTFGLPSLPFDLESRNEEIKIGSTRWNLAASGTLKDWLIAGIVDEDAPVSRCLAHFYNPIGQYGNSKAHYLTDPINVSGRDSFEWASTGLYFSPNILLLQDSPGTNQESWVKARGYYYDSLTRRNKADREENLAHTFYALGKVCHLLQDLSQPEHVRNDAHMINGNETPLVGSSPVGDIIADARWIENYGRDNVGLIARWPELSGIPAVDWKKAGFTKMEDFWDRHLYRGGSFYLNEDASGDTLLGLSEFTNGNFLGADTPYNEMVNIRDSHWFSRPALSDTDISLYTSGLPASPTIWQDTATSNPVSSQFRKSYFIKKYRSGVTVDRHSVLNYSVFFNGFRLGVASPQVFPGVTINAPDVLANLHKITLPKAIGFTAGLMDYFLRGKLEVRVTWDKEKFQYKLDITNRSGCDLKGGSFTLYADDSSDMRSEVYNIGVKVGESSWDSNSILADGAVANATFSPSSSQSKGFMLVYKGTIGEHSDATKLDKIDEDQAIAMCHFQILRFNITWDIKDDIDIYLEEPGDNGSIIYYRNKTSELGELDIDDIPGIGRGIGPENITLKRLKDGDYRVYANFYRSHWPFDDLTKNPPVIKPVNVTMKTYYNSDEPLDTVSFTLRKPNFGSEIPTDKTGPVSQESWYVRKVVSVLEGKVVRH